MKRNYNKFFALINRLPHVDKDELVLQFTDGRTTHLNEMKADEYLQMMGALEEASSPSQAEIKRWRSSALLRIGRLGINTIDNWEQINAFVSSKKIAGKLFYELTVSELQVLVRKLEAIARKGGLKSLEEKPAAELGGEPPAEAFKALKWIRRPTVVS